jgi:ethanolamine ammonia-lyase small subunit
MSFSLDRSRYTPARVHLESAGLSLATSEILDLNLSLAEARDAVHAQLSTASLLPKFEALGLHPMLVKSAAKDRAEYLRRPDLGRRLGGNATELLSQHKAITHSFVIVVADGLSAIAVERHAAPLLQALEVLLSLRGVALVVVEQARVAIGDEIGECLCADLLLMLIGERPGLSSPDSLGAYITWMPRIGCTDAERNCISNIRPEGLSYQQAAEKIAWYLANARSRQLTGVGLKEDGPLLAG